MRSAPSTLYSFSMIAAQPVHVLVVELVHAPVRVHPGVVEDLAAQSAPDPEDVGQADLDALVARKVDTLRYVP